MKRWCVDGARFATFLARDSTGAVLGFMEVSIRSDHVNGTLTSPVAFVEGLYVVPRARRSGTGRELIEAAEEWAALLGCCELAADVEMTNLTGQAFHRAIGFEETERVVYYRKRVEC